jgi:CheY-like chemotaxis protein
MTTPHVLLVEDNLDNRIIYSTALTHAGYTVVEAEDGPAAIASVQHNPPGLILMDVAIPMIDGWEVTRRLKADSATNQIPIVALTAHALESDRLKAQEVGCDGYIAKPALPADVIAAVKQWLGAPVSTTAAS